MVVEVAKAVGLPLEDFHFGMEAFRISNPFSTSPNHSSLLCPGRDPRADSR
jgi:hypothetical protein